MADFCKQCADDMYPPDVPNDFIWINDCKEGESYLVLCEGCGPTKVGNGGVCLEHDDHLVVTP